MGTEILRYAAFTNDPAGGNPAGVVPDATGLSDAEMLRIAADLGYSESAFLLPRPGDARHFGVRYFSPLAEVPFCGHATIASGVALAERQGPGRLVLDAVPGEVLLDTRYDEEGRLEATLTSVVPRVLPVDPDDLAEALAALDWTAEDLDPALPPAVGFAGAYHLIVPVATRERLARLDYDFDRLGALMAERDWTTVALVWRADATEFHVRNPFPPGGVVEDPATGAAAAALGTYLRSRGEVVPPARLTLLQGDDLGRPSLLRVSVDDDAGGIRVSGNAVRLPDEPG